MNRREQGAALIFVLLIVALLSILAVQVNEQLRFNSKRFGNQRDNEQAYWYALGGENLARVLLGQLEDGKPVNLNQAWATQGAVFPIDGGLLQGQIVDGQSCFNLNNLTVERTVGEAEPVESAYSKQFVSMLDFIGIEQAKALQLRDRIQDWIDTDLQPQGLYGAEDLDYSDREQPFQAANGYIVDVSELALLVPLNDEERQLLTGLLCALPAAKTAVNINTLQVEHASLLVALLNGNISGEQASQLLSQRPQDGWESVDQFLNDPTMAGKTLPEDYRDTLTVQSTYFRATINVLYHDTRINLQSLMNTSNNKITVLSRRYGELF